LVAADGAEAFGPVCFDRRVLGLNGGTGVATYAANLRRAAAEAGCRIETLRDAPTADAPTSRAGRWLAAAWPYARAAEADGATRIVGDVFRVAQVRFDLTGRYLRLRSATPPALMHWSYPLPLRFAGTPNLTTVHDLIPLRHPDLSPISAQRARRMLTRLRHEATHLVTVSEASRRDIVAELGWPEARVTNTWQSVEPPDWTADEAEAATRRARAASGLKPGGYFLHVGTVERRKNIGGLIAAYRESGVLCPLILAGPDGWQAAAELRDADAFPPGGGRVLRIPWMERDALLGLMRGARALLAPSLAEGFGLPAVEAMALGVPVMTSAIDITGTPGATAEIAADAALLVDPRDVGDMARAITALDTDADLRGRLIGLGLRRARLFSRRAYAARLRALYAGVLERSGPTLG
jgi:glycosyltransferase involved in cell wall biosynthesis